jgi:hypothetical protein
MRTEHTVNGVHRFLEWARARHAAQAQPEGVDEPVAEEAVAEEVA